MAIVNSPLIWEIIYTMGYPCIYQKYPRPFHDTSTSPRPSHKNQMIWSLYHTLPRYNIDTPYPRPSQTFPTRILKYLYNVLNLLNREFILNTINLNIENFFYLTRVFYLKDILNLILNLLY